MGDPPAQIRDGPDEEVEELEIARRVILADVSRRVECERKIRRWSSPGDPPCRRGLDAGGPLDVSWLLGSDGAPTPEPSESAAGDAPAPSAIPGSLAADVEDELERLCSALAEIAGIPGADPASLPHALAAAAIRADEAAGRATALQAAEALLEACEQTRRAAGEGAARGGPGDAPRPPLEDAEGASPSRSPGAEEGATGRDGAGRDAVAWRAPEAELAAARARAAAGKLECSARQVQAATYGPRVIGALGHLAEFLEASLAQAETDEGATRAAIEARRRLGTPYEELARAHRAVLNQTRDVEFQLRRLQEAEAAG